MTSLALVDRRGRTWLTLSWSRLSVGASVVAPMLVAVGSLLAAADRTPWWPAPCVLALAVLAALVPDSSVGALLFVGYVAWWIAAVGEADLEWTVLAALALLACHGAMALAAAAPSGSSMAGAVRRRYALGLLGIAAAILPVALVAWLAAGSYGAGSYAAPAVLVAGTLLALGALPALVSRPRRGGEARL